jgi:heptosyltransferase III
VATFEILFKCMSDVDTMNQRVKPSFLWIVRQIYWTSRRDHAAIPHLLGTLFRSFFSLAAFWLRERLMGRSPVMIIALTEHLGDIVAAEPVSRSARDRFPTDRICWVVQKPYRALVRSFPAINGTIVVQCLTEWLILWSFGLSDVVWDLHLSERSCPKCRVSFRKPGLAGEFTYATYYDRGNLLAAQCISAGIPPIADGPVLSSDASIISTIDKLSLPSSFVVIHCKSNEACRDWPRSSWIELVQHINEELGLRVIEIGSSSYVFMSNTSLTRSLCGMLSIRQTAEVIRRAKLFIGIDSGPAHIANAVATEGVVLLGDYHDFRHYMPYSGGYQTGDRATLLWAEGPVASLPVQTVIGAIRQRLLQSLPPFD